jgi:hypothetical protein
VIYYVLLFITCIYLVFVSKAVSTDVKSTEKVFMGKALCYLGFHPPEEGN